VTQLSQSILETILAIKDDSAILKSLPLEQAGFGALPAGSAHRSHPWSMPVFNRGRHFIAKPVSRFCMTRRLYDKERVYARGVCGVG